MNSHAKFRGAARRGFSVIYEKPPGGGGGYPPPPVGARVKAAVAIKFPIPPTQAFNPLYPPLTHIQPLPAPSIHTSGVSYRKSEYRYQTKYQPKPRENTETKPT